MPAALSYRFGGRALPCRWMPLALGKCTAAQLHRPRRIINGFSTAVGSGSGSDAVALVYEDLLAHGKYKYT